MQDQVQCGLECVILTKSKQTFTYDVSDQGGRGVKINLMTPITQLPNYPITQLHKYPNYLVFLPNYPITQLHK